MGDTQEKATGSVAITPQVEEVLKRIGTNSKVDGLVVINNAHC